jgi:hypothetical protein
VTVEAAIALCSLALFLVLSIGALIAVAAAGRCDDAARELARLAARGEPERGRTIAAQLAPSGARLELSDDGTTVTSQVSVELRPFPLRIGSKAVAAIEPGVAP